MSFNKAEHKSTVSKQSLTDMMHHRKGYSDVLFFFLKGCVVVIALFLAFFFLMNDLKMSEGKKITQDFLRTAQENIRILETTGDTMNNYFSSKIKKLDHGDAVFVWNMVSKIHLSDMLMWYIPKDRKWRRMSGEKEYQIQEYNVGGDEKMIQNFLSRISSLPPSKMLLTIQQLEDTFSVYWTTKQDGKEGRIPWLFSRKNKVGGYNFLILSSNIKELFSLDKHDTNLKLYDITLRSPDDDKKVFHYSYQENTEKRHFFDRLNLAYGLTIADEGWSVEMTVDPTSAYIIFTTLPWIILLIGVAVVVASSIYLHKQYNNESQLAYISETLADKNTELLGWETEKKKMIAEFRKSEWEYLAIINAVSDIIFEIDQDGRLVFLNDTWEKLTGEKHEDILGNSLFDYFHPEERVYHQDMFQEFISGYRGAYRHEARFKTSEDNFRFVELAFSMMRLSDNEPRVVGTVTDIEKRKRAELAHRSAEQKYTEMFKNSLNGIYQVTPEGKFLSVNQAFVDILGHGTPEELMADIHDMGAQIYVEQHQRKLLEMQVTQHGMISGVETEIYKKDGSKIWILENLRAIYNDDGDAISFEGTIWDITQRRHTDQALRAAKMEAELTSRARIEFMANMSHELRTPLNAVIGFSEIIRNEVMGPIEQDVYKEYANDIHDSGKQLLRIINDILELSQIEIGERELKENEFPILRVVQAVLDLLSHKIKKARVAVTLDIPPDLPRIFAEELAFKQIIMNILSNAIKFTPVEGTVTISARLDSDSSMIIEITDTGIGMTDREVEKALEAFGQVETEMARDNSGTGLGLSIVQSLVELHKGRFMLVSQKDVGTTIKMVFPKERVMMRTIAANGSAN